jgi:type IV pilus assembly protein PilM
LKANQVLGLDIGAASVKLAMLEREKSGGVRLLKYGIADLPGEAGQEGDRSGVITATLKQMLREHGVRRSRAVISVAGQSVFTRFVKLPAATPENIERMVGFEAQQNVPFPMSEVVWGYQLIGGASEKGEYEVVLVAIKSDIIESLAKAVDAAGLHVELVDVSSLALYNAVRYNYGVEEGCTLVADIGAKTTNLIFIEKEKIFTRAVPIGGNTITQEIMREFEDKKLTFAQAEELKRKKGFVGLGGAYEEPEDPLTARLCKVIRNVMTRIHADVTRSVIFYRTQQGGQQPTKLLLAGGSVAMPYADHFFNEKLQIPVEFFNPFRNITLGPAIDQEKLGGEACGYGGAVGLGLRLAAGECPIEVNLLPPYVIERREFNKKKVYFFGCAVGLALVGASWGYYFNQRAEVEQKQLGDEVAPAKDTVQHCIRALRQLESQISRQQKNVERHSQVKDQVKKLVEARIRWHQILEDITQCLPADTWIIQLQPAAGGVPVCGLAGGVEIAPPIENTPSSSSEPPKLPGTAPKEQQITELMIVAGSINKPAEPGRLQKPTEFLDKLRKSAHFDEKTTITKGPTPKEGDIDFTFSITAQLKVPIQL